MKTSLMNSFVLRSARTLLPAAFLLAPFLFAPFLFVSAATALNAQEHNQEHNELLLEGKNLLEKAVISGDKDGLLNANALFERVLSAEPDHQTALYYRSYSEFRLLMYGAGQDKPFMKSLLDKAIEHGENLVAKSNSSSEALALLSGMTMLAIDGMNAMTLGPKCERLSGTAIEKDARNPRAYFIRGMYTMNKPSFFGGGADKALPDFLKAIELCGRGIAQNNTFSNNAPTADWGHVDALTWAGRAYERLEKFHEAETMYKKALTLAPEYLWVKKTLLPRVQQKLSSK